MIVKMVAIRPVASISHSDVTYEPDENGFFSIDERHVEILRSHGLIRADEAGPRANVHGAIAALRAENEQLKAQLAAKNGDKHKDPRAIDDKGPPSACAE